MQRVTDSFAQESAIHGRQHEASVPPIIQRSWQRCRALGLLPDTWLGGALQSNPRSASNILMPLMPILEDVYEFLENSWSALLLADENACVIEMLGSDEVLATLDQLGLDRMHSWVESRIGTNALALALRDSHPIATVGWEHYCTRLHPLAIAAAPLFGPEGQPLGGVALVTQASSYHPQALGMIAAAAQSIHTRLHMDRLLTEANAHLTELNAALETMSEGLLLINHESRIVHLNQRIEQIFGLSARSAAGRNLHDVLTLPPVLERALQQRTALSEQELLFATQRGTLAVVCSLKSIHQQNGNYFGALLMLHPPERVRSLVHQMVGAQAQISFRDIIGESSAVQVALRQARVAANGAANVLLVGEHGTGKELLARAIHQSSLRANGPFVTLNCATIPRTLIGSELFGFESNSEGLLRGRPGKLELAHGGTLLLKAIEALPMEHQSALLRALDTRASIRSGGRRVVPLDVRVITTTTRGLPIVDGRFRPDLAAALSGFTIELPPLRARGYDILLLVEHVLDSLNRRLGKQLVLSPTALQALMAYAWPGNIRELEADLEQIAHATEQSVVQLADLPASIRVTAGLEQPPGGQLNRQYDHIERETILRTGRAVGGHLGRTAQQLGISRSTLWRKMREHGLSRLDFQPGSS
ncbi:MAG: sigma 54-interacting transcriptional regulator [Chloroflexi bacterium]|nr:sigma 54-interacting transcriptional regulator [Chloroflexota bacterium]